MRERRQFTGAPHVLRLCGAAGSVNCLHSCPRGPADWLSKFHAQPEAFRYDVRRYTAMTRAGWLVVRFVWEDVMHRQAYVASVLADLVGLRARMQAVHGATG